MDDAYAVRDDYGQIIEVTRDPAVLAEWEASGVEFRMV